MTLLNVSKRSAQWRSKVSQVEARTTGRRPWGRFKHFIQPF